MKPSKLRERMRSAARQPKQTTLDSLPKETLREPAIMKQILIKEIGTETREDELVLKIGFRLLPSKTAFSKLALCLWFDCQQLSGLSIRVPQGPLTTNDFEVNPVLGMAGIEAGPHTVKVGIYEPWEYVERLSYASREITVNYAPQARESRFVRIRFPTVKRVAGADLAIISESEKNVYREIEETEKKERIAKRDEW